MISKIIFLILTSFALFMMSAVLLYYLLTTSGLLIYYPLALVVDFVLLVFLGGVLINWEDL